MANSVTARGLHVIKQWERFRALPYKDGMVMSIGFGHSSIMSTPAFNAKSVWTPDYAHDVLANYDLPYFGKLLEPHLKVEIPDSLYSCIISLCMNKGVGRLVRSDNWKILHDTSDKYHKEEFCESILKYAIEAPNVQTEIMEEKKGLRWRRIAEAGLYLQDRSDNYL